MWLKYNLKNKTNAVSLHDDLAEEWDEKYLKSEGFKDRFNVFTDLIDQYLYKGCKVLDIGCGTGVLTFYCASNSAEVVGIDDSAAMIDTCNRKLIGKKIGGIRFIKMNIDNITNIDFKPDIIICSSVLEYIPDIESTIVNFREILNYNGILIFSLANSDSLHRRVEFILYKFFHIPRYFGYVKTIMSLKNALLIPISS